MSKDDNGKDSAKVCYIGADRRLGTLLENRLMGCGVAAAFANDAITGIRLVRHYKPRVIIVDERLGNRNSLAVLASLRRLFAKEETALVWHAGTVTREKVRAAVRAGVDSIVLRPLTFPVLLKRINEQLHSHERVVDDKEVQVPKRPLKEQVMKKLAQVQTLNAVPYVVERVLQITGDDETSARDLEQVIESDPQVAAVVLKRANSPFYGAVRKIGKILDAVARIGFREVRALVMGLSVVDMFSREQKSLDFDRLEFWKASLTTAVVARQLAEEAGEVNPDDAFMCGLLHDLGRIIFDEYYSDAFSQAIAVAERYRTSLIAAERKIFSCDHQTVGKLVLQRWQFPQILVDVVGCHEELDRIEKMNGSSTRAMARTIWAAAWIAQMLPLGCSGERLVSYPQPDELKDMKFWKALEEEFAKNVFTEVRDLLSFVGAQLSSPVALREEDTADRTVLLYEETTLPISPMELLFAGANFNVRHVQSPEEVGESDPRSMLALEFKSLDSFQKALTQLPKREQPLLVFLPKGDFPQDDRIKERVGLPTKCVAYLQKPIHRDEFWDTLRQLALAHDDQPDTPEQSDSQATDSGPPGD